MSNRKEWEELLCNAGLKGNTKYLNILSRRFNYKDISYLDEFMLRDMGVKDDVDIFKIISAIPAIEEEREGFFETVWKRYFGNSERIRGIFSFICDFQTVGKSDYMLIRSIDYLDSKTTLLTRDYFESCNGHRTTIHESLSDFRKNDSHFWSCCGSRMKIHPVDGFEIS
jgi:hypothetical protein